MFQQIFYVINKYEKDLENELTPKVETYRAWYEENKRDKMCECVKQHKFQKIACIEEVMVQDVQVPNSNVMASKSLHTFKCQTQKVIAYLSRKLSLFAFKHVKELKNNV